jgi:uncharacterized protein YegL
MEVKMKAKWSIVALMLLLPFFNLFSQSFHMYSIDTSNFPNMRALFYARTPMGVDYPNIVPTDFELYENGINLSSTVGVDCKKVDFYPQLAVVLVLDVSTSMSADAGNGERRIDWVKQGAFAFLDSIKLDPPSVIGYVLFAGDVYKTSPLYDTKAPLYDWLNINLTINAGSTDFYPPFVRNYPPLGALPLLETSPKDLRRVVIFLTDGEPERPFQNWKADTVISYAKRIKAQVYSIFITTPPNNLIDWICQNTGGKSFSVYTKSALISAFRQIVGDIQSRNVCYLTWVSPYGCDEQSRNRAVKAIFKRIPDSVQTDYLAPSSSIAKLSFSENLLLFGAPGIGTTTRQLTLKAENADFTISSFSLSTTGKFTVDWKGKTLPFTIPKNQTHTIEIKYIESPAGASSETIFQIQASPCTPQPVSLVAPCGGDVVKNIDFGKVAISSSKSHTENCSFRNTTAVPVEVTLSIEGTDSSQFKIVSGTGPFVVEPNKCLDVVVQFNPNTVGAKSAKLKYNIPSYCGEHFTNLIGEGIPSTFPVEPVDFGTKRILTINDTTVSIKNSTPLTVVIQSIKFSTQNDTNFQLISLPTFPLTLNKDDKFDLKIRFNPQVEGYLENQLQIDIKDFPEPVYVTVFGIGGLPKIDAPDVNCGKVKVGNTITGNLIITNPSKTMDLFVKEIILSVSAEFKFGAGAVTTNFTVPKNGGSVSIPIDFTPATVGKRSCIALVKSDAAPGPNPNPIVNDTVELFGYGEGLVARPDPMDFGEISACTTKDMNLEIDNSQFPVDLVLNSVKITGTDKDNFQVISFPNKILANQKGNVVIRFIPVSSKNSYSATVEIESSNGPKTIELFGKSFVENAKVVYKLNANKFEVGKDLTLSFEVEIKRNHSLPITEIQFEFKLPRKSFTLRQFSSDLTGWNWDIKPSNDGYVVSGKGTAVNTPIKLSNTVVFETYLSDVSSPVINIVPIFPELSNCLIPQNNSQTINLITCFTEGRLIEISDKVYSLSKINPNPVTDDLNLDFEIAFDDNVELAIYNFFGEKVVEVVNSPLKAGHYSFYINASELPSGVYFARLRSGSYSTMESFVIMK